MHYCIASQNKGVLFIILLIIIINIIIKTHKYSSNYIIKHLYST